MAKAEEKHPTQKQSRKQTKIAPWKTESVDTIVKLIQQYPIVGVINMENLPAKQLANMRKQLQTSMALYMSKKRIIKIAIEKAKAHKKGIEQLEPYLKGMPALLFTKENPFALYKTLQKSKSTAVAKAGQTAPKDIVVKAGPTSFAPGPVISELGQAGIKAGIEAGKVAIKQDSVIVKEGQVIKPNVASILQRLGIEPMEIGLNLVVVYENGEMYSKDILAVDETQYLNNITQAHSWALNLAIDVAYPSSSTIELLVQKAFRDGKGLAISQGIMAKEVVPDILAKAEREMLSVKEKAAL